ncbi:uncharacterized protein BJ171DRAFT_139025 [Polychytrium aggregatum]|uniref:uncharacterized protein n=1 Tax=Polychytrium aggregatum TaxID=110093 RepID=UPI0022FDF61D|nr:uncharacterized protein BJ171DRAFT_139025 [Polychytrium aggregatum]KAI9203696.1 hypothetical protein BJ171DRAFT_139025 [Polychytrium aggregatum]
MRMSAPMRWAALLRSFLAPFLPCSVPSLLRSFLRSSFPAYEVHVFARLCCYCSVVAAVLVVSMLLASPPSIVRHKTRRKSVNQPRVIPPPCSLSLPHRSCPVHPASSSPAERRCRGRRRADPCPDPKPPQGDISHHANGPPPRPPPRLASSPPPSFRPTA